MPNTGKSTFFNRLTGASARIGNWPGVTVDLLSARLIVGGSVVEVVDLPGIYDMRGFSDDEAVVREFLSGTAVDLVALVVNAVQLERQLHIALQVKALGLPCVLFVNMKDEADQLGPIADLPGRLSLPVSYVSTGQEVPDDLELAGADRLARRIAPTLMNDAVLAAAGV